MGATQRMFRVPAFGDVATAKTKDTPQDAFAPRGKEVHFLGCVDNATHGALIGTHSGDGWDLGVSSSVTIHGVIEEEYDHQEEQCEAQVDEHGNEEEFKDFAVETAGPRTRPQDCAEKFPKKPAVMIQPSPRTTYRTDAFGSTSAEAITTPPTVRFRPEADITNPKTTKQVRPLRPSTSPTSTPGLATSSSTLPSGR